MAEGEIKKFKLAKFVFETGIPLTEISRVTGICYPTLENLKFGRPVNYRQRTLRDVASYCKCTIEELLEGIFEEDKEDKNDDTVFSIALSALSKKHNKNITLQDVHEATGVSLPILSKLKKGGKVNCRKRTIRDVAEFLEIPEEQLWGNEIKKSGE